jgi:hypothetical protein
VAGPWRVSYDEHGGYDCMTSSFDVLKTGEGPYGPTVLQAIVLDLGDYGERTTWDPDEPKADYEQAWQDARTICEALNARDGGQS